MAGFDDGDAAQHGSGFRRVQADGDFLHVIRLGEFRVRSQDAALLFRLLPARAVQPSGFMPVGRAMLMDESCTSPLRGIR